MLAKPMYRQLRVARIVHFRARCSVVVSSILVFICLSSALALAQGGAGSASPPSAAPVRQSGAPSAPALPPNPQIQPTEQPKPPAEGAAKNRQNVAQPAPKTLELTDFQQFAAQSLGY